MTTFKHPRGKTWRYDFRWRPPGWTASTGKRETGSTGQFTKKDADRVEAEIRTRLSQQAWGLVPFDRMQTPSFSAWAETHFEYVQQKGKVQRLDAFEQTLRLALQFWGRRPTRQPALARVPNQWRQQVAAKLARAAAAPYHNLRLADPILDPEWIDKFEDWLTSLGLSGPRKNHYRSAMSGMYRTALLPRFRKKTNVSSNPFAHIERDHVPERDVVLTLEQLRAWMLAAPPHTRLAMAIAAYAPELRERSILELRWTEHLDPALARIVVPQHKTRRHTRRPQIVPISADLQQILAWARREQPHRRHVISYRGEPVASLKTGLRNAVRRANRTLPKSTQLVYGVTNAGATFHTIRHTMATLMAEWGVPEALRQMVMGHASLATTQKYTHLAARSKIGPLSDLGARLQLTDVVQGPVQARGSRRASKA